MNPTQTALFNLKAARPVPPPPPPNRFQLVGYQGQSPIVRVPGGQPFVAGQIETNGAIEAGGIRTRQVGNDLRIDGMPRVKPRPQPVVTSPVIDWEFLEYEGASWTKDRIPAINGPVKMERGQQIEVKIAYEDAANSGGTNDATQSGWAIARFFGLARQIRVEILLNAVIEQENAGFEEMRIMAVPQGYRFEPPFALPQNARELYLRASVNRRLGLQMETIEDALEPQVLEPGEALVFFSSTNDGLWHVGAFWQATLVFD